MAYSNYYLNQRLSNLQYQVNQISNPTTGYVPIEGNATVNGIKTFAQAPPQTPIAPLNANDLVNKTYVDGLIPTPINAVLIDGSQTIGTGIKTFTNLPQSSTVPVNNNDLVNKLYVDGLIPTPINAVLIDGSQTIGTGIKTFTNLPQSNTVPVNNDDLVNKTYVDTQVSTGLTLSQVLSNTSPFTALQSFNSGITLPTKTNLILRAGSTFSIYDVSNTYYSNIQQVSDDLSISNISNGGLINLLNNQVSNFVGNVSGALSGIAFGWNGTANQGESDLINYAQYGSGGFNFYTSSNSTPATLLAQIPSSTPAFNDTSATILSTNYWVQGAITNAISGGGGATLAGANTFTAQNIFNNFCPQSSVAPSVDNSLVNLQYLNSVLTTNGIQNYNYKVPSFSTTNQYSSFSTIQIQIPQNQFTNTNTPWKSIKIRFNYILTGNSNNLIITNTGIINLYPLNTTSNNGTANYSYQGAGGVTFNGAGSATPNYYKYNITNNLYTSTGTISNSYNAVYTDDFNLANLNRWYYISNINGGSPSGVSGTPYFSYINYIYNGAGLFTVGFTTPPANPPATIPSYTGNPGYGTATSLSLNIFFEVLDNDFTGSTISFSNN